MPQVDDKVGIYFGSIAPAVWQRIEDQPGAIVEKAVAELVRARERGDVVHFPTTRSRRKKGVRQTGKGIRKKLWLTPETVKILEEIGEETGAANTPIILAALNLYLGPLSPSSPSDASADPGHSRTVER